MQTITFYNNSKGLWRAVYTVVTAVSLKRGHVSRNREEVIEKESHEKV